MGLGWQPFVFAVMALTVVRMLPVAIALLGFRAKLPTVAFVAWFGPRGLASIVFGVLILQADPTPNVELIVATTSVTIVLSVYAHGVSAVPAHESLRRLAGDAVAARVSRPASSTRDR